MPKITKEKSETAEIITFRLDKDTALYYRKRAKEHGTTLSDFIRQTVVSGMIAESALDVEKRLRDILAEFDQKSRNASAATLNENVLMSIYLTEEILTKIIEAKSIQELYEAQDRAKARLKKERV